jgi:SPP1 gp7 family putative phage head morphogenesis protein
MKRLEPIIIKQHYHYSIESKILEYFNEILFDKIEDLYQYYFENTKKKLIFNSKLTEIEKFLRNYKLQYINGFFVGKFNSKISKELRDLGAKFNTRNRSYQIESYKLPKNILNLIERQNKKIIDFKIDLDQFLYEFTTNIKQEKIVVIDFNQDVDKILIDLDQQLKETTRPYLLTVDLTDKIRKNIDKNYTYNMNLYIKDFLEEQTIDLRKQINDLIFDKGLRAESIKDILEDKYNISQKKAKFLAMQETSLLVSKYRQERYQNIGLDEYIWSTSKDSRVRDTHRELDGKRFRWNHPPSIKGRLINPGEDFGCRCVAIPIIE